MNIINNKILTKNIFKNKSERKRNFITYHFLVESKPHERIDILITVSVNIYQTKKIYIYSNSNENMLSEGKLTKQFETPFLRELPFQLTPYF